eukprot:gene6932-22120_t
MIGVPGATLTLVVAFVTTPACLHVLCPLLLLVQGRTSWDQRAGRRPLSGDGEITFEELRGYGKRPWRKLAGTA